MKSKTTLDKLLPFESGTVLYINDDSNIKSRFRDLGIIKDTEIKCLGKSPMGDPKAYLIRGSSIAIRNEDAKNIVILKNETISSKEEITLLLAGNPNVGKSTIFNTLTGLKQHTGNWTGKTVDCAEGFFETENNQYKLIDLPGTYSLNTRSPEEVFARDMILNGNADGIVVVLDATNLEHGLNLALQIKELCGNILVCINLLDEAKRKGIEPDIDRISKRLNLPVIGISAREKRSKNALLNFFDSNVKKSNNKNENISEEILFDEKVEAERIRQCEAITKECTKNSVNAKQFGKADKVLTSKRFGYPIMLIMLVVLFWITIYGANYPSQLLSSFFAYIEKPIISFLYFIKIPEAVISFLIDGIYNMTTRVISVMLPPMAIFFPLFTILEDLGYLPRIAFNLDKPFNKCKACGKQALTMCMGFGCNVCGVTGARIIDSPRERLLAIATNSFVPCNGKFPTIIAIITMFLVTQNGKDFLNLRGGLILAFIILLCILLTFLATFTLSHTILKGEPTSFILELPPYRKPQFARVAIRSVFDRTAVVLYRAIKSAVPAGIVVWLVANIYVNGSSVLSYCVEFLNPFATIFGMDGVIFVAFILGIAANETVIPIMIMSYLSQGSPIEMNNIIELRNLLIENNWTVVTAICTIIFALFHWPCATTLITIKKETKSIKWVLISALLPTSFGLLICFIISFLSKCF